MKTFKTIREMNAFSLKAKKEGKTLGLVPTMGCLHEGHLSLVEAAKTACDATVVSIFVNPTQFGKNEDLDKYPRDPERDLRLLREAGVEAVFAPETVEMYPEGFSTFTVPEGGVENLLEGIIRPGHFKGVATVVAKLFNIVNPDKAFFGQKDAQQCLIIKRLVLDLNFPLEVVILPTVREQDGLAKSSRNLYLNAKERKAAPAIYKALQMTQHMIELGEKNPSIITAEIRKLLGRTKLLALEYVVVADPQTLLPVELITGRVHALISARVGTTRLIDNLLIDR